MPNFCFLLSHEALRMQQLSPFSLPLLVRFTVEILLPFPPGGSVVKILLPAASKVWGYCSVRLFVYRCLFYCRNPASFSSGWFRCQNLASCCRPKCWGCCSIRLFACCRSYGLRSKPCFLFLRGLHCRNLAVLSPCDSVVKILLPAAVLNKAQKVRTYGRETFRLNVRRMNTLCLFLVPEPFVPGAFPIAAVCPKC